MVSIKKYAKCLFDETQGKETSILETMSCLLDVFNKKEIVSFFDSPQLSEKEKENILDQVFKDQTIPSELFHLIKILASQSRMVLFEPIFKAFQYLVDEKQGVIRGTLKVPSTIDSHQHHSIEQAMEKRVRQRIIFEQKESLDLAGGVVAEVGHLTFDNSLKTQLHRLKEELSRGVGSL